MPKKYIQATNSFIPSERMTSFLEKILQIRKQEKLAYVRGAELPGRPSDLTSEKTKILNEIVFPSMANLTVFFEQVSLNPELQEVFDDDIIDLLLEAGLKDRESILTRLLLAMVTSSNLTSQKKRYRDYSDNFRLIIFETMANVVLQAGRHYANDPRLAEIKQIIVSDLTRANMWGKFFARQAYYLLEEVRSINRPANF